MTRRKLAAVVACVCIRLASPLHAEPPTSPLRPPSVRDAIAINIHFTTPRPGEMKLLAATGVGRGRMDVGWHHVEREPGKYDFTKYDLLMSELDAVGLRAMLILDYGNVHYTGDQKTAPTTPEARAAFGRFAAATVAHFKGRGVLWEIYNEPNNKAYWKPAPDGATYATLAIETARAIKAVAPDEVLCGPGLAGIDKPFLEKALDGGLLNVIDAVTVHPYRQTAPETFAAELADVRGMIKDHVPAGKDVPVIAGEWGYPVVWVDTPTQVNYLARQMLYGLSERLPLNVWYDWRRGGGYEGRVAIFGLIDAVPGDGDDVTLNPTPLYHALAALGRMIGDAHFTERLPLRRDNNADDYLLAFDGPRGRRYAFWTARPTSEEIKVALPDGVYDLFDVWGNRAGARTAKNGMPYRVSGSPVYAVPAKAATTQATTEPIP